MYYTIINHDICVYYYYFFLITLRLINTNNKNQPCHDSFNDNGRAIETLKIAYTDGFRSFVNVCNRPRLLFKYTHAIVSALQYTTQRSAYVYIA
jgi:hypothetical protein